jgi:hypothetical protein
MILRGTQHWTAEEHHLCSHIHMSCKTVTDPSNTVRRTLTREEWNTWTVCDGAEGAASWYVGGGADSV